MEIVSPVKVWTVSCCADGDVGEMRPGDSVRCQTCGKLWTCETVPKP